MIKDNRITVKQESWIRLQAALAKEHGLSTVAISYKRKEVLGFVMWTNYADDYVLSFKDPKQLLMFTLKYSNYI